MGGFADQRDAALAKAARGLDREGEGAAARFDGNFAEDRMRALLDLVAERGVVERGDALGFGGLDRWPGRGTRVNGPLSVWNSVEVS